MKKIIIAASLVLFCSQCFAHIYIFVSYSMTDAALKAYFNDATNLDTQEPVTLVMKGLYQDSFLASKHKADALGIVYQIEPELFEKYGVNRVPVIVRDNNGDVEKITGHIPLRDALTQFKAAQ